MPSLRFFSLSSAGGQGRGEEAVCKHIAVTAHWSCMTQFLPLEKYSIGVGDRFGQQAQAQLRACVLAEQNGVRVIPVWNKSQREHAIIGSEPASTRRAADTAVHSLGWKYPYHVDADHVRLDTVDRFLTDSDYYTLDVGDAIGRSVASRPITEFIARHPELLGGISVPNIAEPVCANKKDLELALERYLPAVLEAGVVYRHIAHARGNRPFITEISMDETDDPQTPRDLLVILAALADEGVKVQTIAPKFTGRFNKGIDYGGDIALFSRQFREDLAVVAFAVRRYNLPSTLKLSVHSGSDKFSLYEPIRTALAHFDAGLHLKTAGTTWLEELIGLAEADASGCAMVKNIYVAALRRIDELCEPYAAVIAIDRTKLPTQPDVENWNPSQLVSAIAHDSSNSSYNPHMRQLLHVGYKIAAEMGRTYLDALRRHQTLIAQRVTTNLYERHLKPVFLGDRERTRGRIRANRRRLEGP
jgi:hypothetical protein